MFFKGSLRFSHIMLIDESRLVIIFCTHVFIRYKHMFVWCLFLSQLKFHITRYKVSCVAVERDCGLGSHVKW